MFLLVPVFLLSCMACRGWRDFMPCFNQHVLLLMAVAVPHMLLLPLARTRLPLVFAGAVTGLPLTLLLAACLPPSAPSGRGRGGGGA